MLPIAAGPYAQSPQDLQLQSSELVIDMADLTQNGGVTPNLSLFAGFNSITATVAPGAGTPRKSCVDGQAPDLDQIQGGSNSIDSFEADSAEDVADKSLLTVSGGLGYGVFGASGSFQAIHNHHTSGHEMYASLRASWDSTAVYVKNAKLSRDAKHLLDAGLDKFLEACGDTYVAGGQIGAAVQADIQATSISDEDQSLTKRSLNAAVSGGFFSASLDIEQQHELIRTLANNVTSFAIRYVGDNVSERDPNDGKTNTDRFCPAGSLDRMPAKNMNELMSFGATISCRAKAGHSFTKLRLHSYHEFDDRVPDLGSISRIANPLVRNMMKVYTRLASVEFARDNLNQFDGVDSTNLDNEITVLIDRLGKIQHAFDAAWTATNRAGDDSAEAKAFAQVVADAAEQTRDPIHRSQLISNLKANLPSRQFVTSVSRSYPVGVLLWSELSLSGNNANFFCPSNCLNTLHPYFEFEIPNQPTQIVNIDKVQKGVKVPVGAGGDTRVFFVVRDGLAGPGFSDNIWVDPTKHGVLVFEIVR